MLDGGSTVARMNCDHQRLPRRAVDCPAFGVNRGYRGGRIPVVSRHHAVAARIDKAIEIPTDPETGISIEAWSWRWNSGRSKAVILVPNCNNPLGFIMPEARKRQVLALAQRHDIVIVEDDIYGELAANTPARAPFIFDIDGRVLLCSSFTKTVAPGLRVGWIVPGRCYDRVMHMKYAGGFNVPATQMAVAAFIRDGHYHRHMFAGCARFISKYGNLHPWCGSIFPLKSA
jgi:DNA-binding transcriptional MocR family regulator